MAEQPIEIPIKLGGISEIRKELKEIKGQIINATDPAEIQRLTQRAGELSDKMKDVNEQVSNLASGSKFEQISNSFGSIGTSIANLDFQEASTKAKAFATNLKGLSPADIGVQIKGLASTVLTLGKAFFTVGLQILTNPIFLLVAVITAIVVAVGVFLNKLGLLKPIFDAIGKAIGWVVQQFKNLTDWLGFTDFAGEEYAKNESKRLDMLREKNEAFSKQKIKAFDEQIRIQKAYGKDTEELERKRQEQLVATSKIEFELLGQKISDGDVVRKLSEEERKELREKFSEAKEAYRIAKVDLRVFNVEQETEEKESERKKLQTQREANNERANKNREAKEKEKEAQKRHNEELLEIERQRVLNIKNLENEFYDEVRQLEQENFNRTLSDDQIKEQAIAEKYFRLQELAKGNIEQEKIIEEARKNELNDLAVQRGQEELAIQDEKNKQLAENQKKADEEEMQRLKDKYNASLDVAKSGLQGISDIIGAFAGKSLAQQKKAFETQKKLNIAIATIDTIKGAVSAYTGMVAQIQGPVGIALGIVAAAGVVASGVAQIAKIRKTKFDGGGSVGSISSGAGGGSASAVQSAQPQFNLFGKGNDLNTAKEGKNVQGKETQPIKAYVSETDITSKQKKATKFEQFATL